MCPTPDSTLRQQEQRLARLLIAHRRRSDHDHSNHFRTGDRPSRPQTPTQPCSVIAMMHPTPPTTTSRPLPKRLHTLQHTPSYGPLTPLPATPHGYSYPSLLSSPTSPTSPTPAGRPGAPKRSHSFCGDSSASTYALASASSASHLSEDKKVLVAPPLERTISSIGNRGNFSPPEQQMKRPFLLDARSRPSRSGVSPLSALTDGAS